MTPPPVVAQLSGSHWATAEDWRARLAAYRRTHDYITCTEVTKAQWPGFEHPGWDGVRIGEIALLWRKDRATIKRRAVKVMLSRVVYYTGNGGRRRVPAASVVLHDKWLGAVVLTGIHLPSSVQDGTAYGALVRRNRAHRSAMRRLRHRSARARARGRLVLVGADLNVDLRRAEWRAQVINATGLDLCWTSNDAPGTHGPRCIDAVLTSGTASTPQVQAASLPRKPWDHRDVHSVRINERTP